MSTTVADRQYELIALADLTKANIGATVGYDIGVPPQSAVLVASVSSLTAFDGTTVTLTIKDSATPPNTVGTIDLKAAAGTVTALPLIAPKIYPSGVRFDLTVAQTGTSTVGRAIVALRYITLGRSNEVMT